MTRAPASGSIGAKSSGSIGAKSAQTRARFRGSVDARGRRDRLPTQGGGLLVSLPVARAGTAAAP